MQLTIIAAGSRMESWVQAGFVEYQRRFPRECSLQLRETALAPRNRNTDIARAMERESRDMLAAIPPGDRVVALDVRGRTFSTEELASTLSRWKMEGLSVSFLIGGPDGLGGESLRRADEKWSLSALTLPHPLVRIVLAEQLYRALMILQNHPYHRG